MFGLEMSYGEWFSSYGDGPGEIIKERQHRRKVKARVHGYKTGPAREAEKKVKERDGRNKGEPVTWDLRET